jgi:hypothetical protein
MAARLKRDAQALKSKAISSLRRSTEAFNSHNDEGRATAVLLHLQHSFEMLLKACLVQAGRAVHDKDSDRSIGLAKCINLGKEVVALSEDEAGLLRVIDALRNEEQHWYHYAPESLLYAHCRAAVTIFDSILQRAFGDRLIRHMPLRILPLSVEPPRDIQLLLNEEYSNAVALLQPGGRRGHEARARIRFLLALQAHVVEEFSPKAGEIARIERAMKSGKSYGEAFPSLQGLVSVTSGEGLSITVKIGKVGAPFRYASDGEASETTIVTQVDSQKKYYLSKTALSEKLNITTTKCKLLREELNIDEDERFYKDFIFGRSRHRQYSDNAYVAMRDGLERIDLEELWSARRKRTPAA